MRKKLMALLMAITLLDCNNQIVACASTDVLESEETAETESVFETEISFDNEPDTEVESEISEETTETDSLKETVEATTSIDTETETDDETVIETEDVQDIESADETETTETETVYETGITDEAKSVEEITETINEESVEVIFEETAEAVAAEPETNIYTPDEVVYDAIVDDAAVTTRCYDQLNDFGKYIYDELIKAYPEGITSDNNQFILGTGGEDGEPIGSVGYVPGKFDLYYNSYREEDNMGYDYCCVFTTKSSQYAKDYMENLFLCVIKAITTDYPEKPWFSDSNYQLRTVPYPYEKNTNEMSAKCKITKFTVYIYDTPSDCNKTTLDSFLNSKVYPILGDMENLNNYQKIKRIHNWICENIQYEKGTTDVTYYQSVYSFIKDIDNDGFIETVCSGYASMFNILCNHYNIPCINILGYFNENHEWNAVQMEDGEWYAVDVTWNDGEPYTYDYLLVGNNTYNINDKLIFGNSHLAGQTQYIYQKENFRFLDIADEKYISEEESPIIVDKAGKIIYLNGNDIRICAGSNGKTKIQYESNGSYGIADIDPDTAGIQQEADLSQYTVYGTAAGEDAQTVNIIMTGGSVKNIYATAPGRKVAGDISVQIEDGTVSGCISGGNAGGTVSGYSNTGNTDTSTFDNVFAVDNGQYVAKGKCRIPEGCTVIIPEEHTLEVKSEDYLSVRGKLIMPENSKLVCKFPSNVSVMYPGEAEINGEVYYNFDGTFRISSTYNTGDVDYYNMNDFYSVYYCGHPVTVENNDIKLIYPVHEMDFKNSAGEKRYADVCLDGWTLSYEDNDNYFKTMKVIWTKGEKNYSQEVFLEKPCYYDITVTAYDGVYDGNTHEAVTLTGDVEWDKITVEYSTDNGLTFTQTVPLITEIGETKVTVRLSTEGCDSYTYDTVTAKVTDKKNIDISEISIVPYEGAYDGYAHNAVTISGPVYNYTVEYKTDGDYSSYVPVITEAGTLEVTVKISAKGYHDYIVTVTAVVFPEETETEPESGTETETESSTQTETEGSSEPESSTETETETETKTETESSTPAYEDLKITVAEIPDAVYTGKAVKPEIKVYNNNRLLEINKDYSVSYKNNTNAGTATVTVKGKGNLTDSKTVRFKILPKDLSDDDIITEDLAVAYNKKLQKKLPSVTYNGKKLKAKDYTVTKGEGDFTAPGTYTVTFAGKGNYTGKVTGKLIITDKSKIISSAKTGKIPEQTYDGKPVTPDFTVTLSGKVLAKDRDYTVSYVSNNAPGKATAVIKGCGEYAGTKTVSFNIKKGITSLTGSMVSVTDNMVYDRQGCTPEPVVTDAGYVLVKGTDYTVSYKNNKKTGTASVTVKGKGLYAGSVTKTFTIRQADIADTVMRVPDIVYTGKAGKYVSKPVLMDTNGNILSLNKDYANIIYMADGKVLGKKANPEYGTVITVTVTGKGNYKGTATAIYTLKGTSFAKAKVNGNITKTYTGKRIEIKPSDLKVSLNGKLLSYGTDYEIVEGTYRNNIKKGTASVVIRGLGDYAGEKTVKFKITAKSIR